MDRKILRRRRDDWCRLDITLTRGRLSVTGAIGHVSADDLGAERYVTTATGTLREELKRWFPEVRPLFAWHLNHMRADCVHQEDAVRHGRKRYEPGEACETCGHRYSSWWCTRELPAAITELAETIYREEERKAELPKSRRR